MSDKPVATMVFRNPFISRVEFEKEVKLPELMVVRIMERAEVLFDLAKKQDYCFSAELFVNPLSPGLEFNTKYRRHIWPDVVVANHNIPMSMMLDQPDDVWESYCKIVLQHTEVGVRRTVEGVIQRERPRCISA